MTRPLLEPEAATRPLRLGPIAGLVLGVVATVVLSWLIVAATIALNRAVGDADNAGIAFAGLLLLVTGVVLGVIGFSGRYHPLVPGVPAIWLAIVLGPSLVGLGSPPSWMPDFVNSFFLRSASPGIYLAFGYLLLAAGLAVYRRRHVWIFR